MIRDVEVPEMLHGTGRHVVLVAPSRDDSGNRMALEALLELTRGPFDVVVGVDAGQQVDLPSGSTSRVLPALLSGSKHDQRAAMARVERLLAPAAFCTVIAPDSMSTREDAYAFVRCIALARAAAEAGLDTRMVGITWSFGGGGVGVLALQAAMRAGVRLFVRDDFSLMRAMNEGLIGFRRGADLALAATAVDSTALARCGVDGGPFALLTVCAAVAPGVDAAGDYVALAEHLQRRGLRLLLVPSAATGYDLLLLGRVARALPGGVAVVRRPLTAAELRAVTAEARLTVTDRTRTAMVALSAGCSVIGLAARRELEGLLRAAGLPDRSVVPSAGFAGVVRPIVDAVLAERPGQSCATRAAVAAMAELARETLHDLPLRVDGSTMRATG